MLEKRVIEFNKKKVVQLILGAIAFMLIGIWFLSMDPEFIDSQRRFNNPIFIYGLGVVSILFFGLCSFFGIKKLLTNSPGLIISAEGILDNSSGISMGLIPWTDVTGIGVYEVQKQKFISIRVADPEKYANNGNAIQRMANRANIKMCGTPINISAGTLNIDHDNLLAVINKYYQNCVENA